MAQIPLIREPRTAKDYTTKSQKSLEELIGRAKSNCSRTLEVLQRYGIVELHKENNVFVSEVKASYFQVEFELDAA